jgi:hypothetical protein
VRDAKGLQSGRLRRDTRQRRAIRRRLSVTGEPALGRSRAPFRAETRDDRAAPIRRIDADERLLQCAHREPDADREPQANRQPDDEPFASITHGDTSCAPARPAPPPLAVERYWDAERVVGEATFDHRSVPPRRFSRPTREAASCVPLRTDRGPLSPRLPFHGRIKALDVMSTYSRDWSRMGTKAIVLSATRDSGRLVPSRARPFAFSLLRRELQAFRCFVSRQAELGERRRWWH